MSKIYFKDLNNYFNKEVTLEGFVDNIRDLQYVQFVILRDSTGKVQVTIEKSEEKNKEMIDLISFNAGDFRKYIVYSKSLGKMEFDDIDSARVYFNGGNI